MNTLGFEFLNANFCTSLTGESGIRCYWLWSTKRRQFGIDGCEWGLRRGKWLMVLLWPWTCTAVDSPRNNCHFVSSNILEQSPKTYSLFVSWPTARVLARRPQEYIWGASWFSSSGTEEIVLNIKINSDIVCSLFMLIAFGPIPLKVF